MDDNDELRRAVAARNGKSALKRSLGPSQHEAPLDEMAGGGLSRLLKHMNRPFAMISASRETNSPKENLARTAKLAEALVSLRIGALKMEGYYAPTDSREISFFVPMPQNMDLPEFRELMLALSERFDQDSIALSDGKRVAFWYADGRKADYLGNVASLSPQAIQQGWSKIRNKRFSITKKGSGSHLDHTKLKD